MPEDFELPISNESEPEEVEGSPEEINEAIEEAEATLREQVEEFEQQVSALNFRELAEDVTDKLNAVCIEFSENAIFAFTSFSSLSALGNIWNQTHDNPSFVAFAATVIGTTGMFYKMSDMLEQVRSRISKE